LGFAEMETSCFNEEHLADSLNYSDKAEKITIKEECQYFASSPAQFVVKTFLLISDVANHDCVSWSSSKDSFIIWKPNEFASQILPRYFKHSNLNSFVRQLNAYGFHKVETEKLEFKHSESLFKEGMPNLLNQIERRKSKKRDASQDKNESCDLGFSFSRVFNNGIPTK